jgi:DnaK suppressor protein
MPTLVAKNPFTQQLAANLTQRQSELRALLQSAAAMALPEASPPDVQDFKDVAAEDARAAIDEVAYAHASEELARVVAALRRIDEGSYGQCTDCGEPIDERRLLALPATPFCTACQAIHERPPFARR